jgi:Bacterial dnaA protein helix-turn-helix
MSYLETLQIHYKAVRMRLDPPPRKLQPQQPQLPVAVIADSTWSKPEIVEVPRPVVYLHKFEILSAVCREFEIRRDQIVGRRSTLPIVVPRQVAMYLMREIMEYSYPQIGRIFKRDHTCALLARRKITAQIVAGTALGARAYDLESVLRDRLGKPKEIGGRYAAHDNV